MVNEKKFSYQNSSDFGIADRKLWTCSNKSTQKLRTAGVIPEIRTRYLLNTSKKKASLLQSPARKVTRNNFITEFLSPPISVAISSEPTYVTRSISRKENGFSGTRNEWFPFIRKYVGSHRTFVKILHLTQWSTASLRKLTVAQLVKIFPRFYATRKFITVFKGACWWPQSWAR